MIGPLSELALLLLDTSYSWIRMLIALAISLLLSIFMGIAMARSKAVGRILVPLIDILQTLPILAFFPIAIYLVLAVLPGLIGINFAVIFLIITSMLWNMIFGVYEAIRTLPNELIEIGRMYRLTLYQRLKNIFIPASLPRLSEQMSLSWAIGLFYLVTSEIFSTGSQQYAVQGIGVDLANLGFSGNSAYYALGIAVFVIFVIVTRLTLFSFFDRFANKFSLVPYGKRKRESTFNLALKRPVTGIFNALRPYYVRLKDVLSSVGFKEALKATGYLVVVVFAILVALFAYPYISTSTVANLASYEFNSLESLLFSFLRIWGAFAAIIAVAIPISIYVVFLSTHRNSYLLIFQVLASIPATILLPLLVYVSKSGEVVAFLVFFLSGLWYVIFSIIASTKYLQINTDEIIRIFKVRGLYAWRKIYLKAIAPGLITGAVTAIAAEWNASIIA